jgi:hypothetical protein
MEATVKVVVIPRYLQVSLDSQGFKEMARASPLNMETDYLTLLMLAIIPVTIRPILTRTLQMMTCCITTV